MKPEAQRIAIAEAVFDALVAKDGMTLYQHPVGTEGYRGIDLSGWWIYRRADGSLHGTNWPTQRDCRDGNIGEIAKHSNFPADLNAMHEAEKTLPDVLVYADELDRLTGRTSREFEVIHATAAQRAEAFLRAKGLWVE